MTIIIGALIICIGYLWTQLTDLRKEQRNLAIKHDAYQSLLGHFMNHSKSLKEDVLAYKGISLLESSLKDFTTFGEMRSTIWDRSRYLFWLHEKEGDPIIDSWPDPVGDKMDQLLKDKIHQVLTSIQQTHSSIIDKSYSEWFETSWPTDCHSFACLRWMLPEIENKLDSKKITIPDDLKKLKTALTTGDWDILIPNLLQSCPVKLETTMVALDNAV